MYGVGSRCHLRYGRHETRRAAASSPPTTTSSDTTTHSSWLRPKWLRLGTRAHRVSVPSAYLPTQSALLLVGAAFYQPYLETGIMSSYDRYVPKVEKSKSLSSPSSSSSIALQRQYRDMQKNPVQGFSCGLPDESNFYEWDVLIIGPQDTVYEGGFLKARLSFPTEYPLLPPKMKVGPNSQRQSSRQD